MKRFVIGFAIGMGLMYWYLENGERVFGNANSWMEKSASGYRHDRVHDAAKEVAGEKAQR
ncbi:MAG: hypothetical protein HY699_23875 [Deltaproteobacteria bacterium]|nr:hypothetical protein [Deltaproteobacteria bacterium]